MCFGVRARTHLLTLTPEGSEDAPVLSLAGSNQTPLEAFG